MNKIICHLKLIQLCHAQHHYHYSLKMVLSVLESDFTSFVVLVLLFFLILSFFISMKQINIRCLFSVKKINNIVLIDNLFKRADTIKTCAAVFIFSLKDQWFS